MKFIGGDDMSAEEQKRVIEAQRQRRWIRYALRPKRDLIALIHRWDRDHGVTRHPESVPLETLTPNELANMLIAKEDGEALRQAHLELFGQGHEKCPTINGDIACEAVRVF